MNKVVLLKEIKGESKNIERNIENNTESLVNQYSDFEECIFNNKLNRKINSNTMSRILEKNFYFSKSQFIYFLNSIYNDYLGTNSIVEFYKEDEDNSFLVTPNCIFNAKVEDDYRTLEYKIEIQCNDYENIAILVHKKKDTYTNTNILNFKKKKDEYKSLIENNQNEKKSDMCLIMLNSDMNIPEKYYIGKSNSQLKIIKLWKYDFKKILENEMQLLLPIKVLDLKNVIKSMKNINNSEKIIKYEVQRFYDSMYRYMIKLKERKIITDNEIELLLSSSKEILSLIY